jgi:hypothetical protein
LVWFQLPVLKLLLLSIVLMTFVVPAYAARTTNPVRALQTALGGILLVELWYAFFLYFLYIRLM